jgi:hypothetical protein
MTILLMDGRVPAAGGGYGGSPLATTEVYDPVTQTFMSAWQIPDWQATAPALLKQLGRPIRLGAFVLGVGVVFKDVQGVLFPSVAPFLL